MTKTSIGIAAVVIILVVIALSFACRRSEYGTSSIENYQAVEGGKSQYSAALNTCTEKIKGVWEIANQYMKHESETFIAVAQARSGYDTAREAFEKAAAEGKDTEALTQAGTEVVKAAMAFRIQVEAYPRASGGRDHRRRTCATWNRPSTRSRRRSTTGSSRSRTTTRTGDPPGRRSWAAS